jgi:Cytochrome P450
MPYAQGRQCSFSRRTGPLVRVNSEEVSVCNDEAVPKILNAPLDKGSWYRIFAMPDSSFKNQMSELSAKKYAVVQRKIARGYAASSLIKMEDRFDRAVLLFMDGVGKDAAKDPDGAVALDEWFTFYSFDIVGLVTFSREFGFLTTGSDVGDCIATSNALTIYLAVMAYFPDLHDWLTAVLSPILLRLGLQPMKHVLETTEQALHSREVDDAAGNDMVSHWKHQKEDDPLSARDLFSTANANVAAGGDTVGTIEQAFMYYMLKNPRCVERLQAELDEAARQGKISAPVGYQAALQLPYFQACVSGTFSLVRACLHQGMPRGRPPFVWGTSSHAVPAQRNPPLPSRNPDRLRPHRAVRGH